MLVDAAKQGDIEIPYFCYEPKLGNPVGACRMCLVEIEGIPKLQTSCSTPVKDGMVVHTQTDRVHHAQNAIVEFLLVNHPLDCPVCDKGGECPLQDITFGWGLGRSRFIEPKRHFEKPLALSPLIAIDRERCILCYRCVRFSQEISEDYQLIFTERGAHTFVGTHDGHPYVAPFSGNIVELCPVGRADLAALPLPRAAVGHRGRRRDLHAVPVAVQRRVHGARREGGAGAVRDATGAATGGGPGGNPDVDDGWLCDKGRFAYQAIHVDERITQPLVRDGGSLRPVSWERALDAAAGLARHGRRRRARRRPGHQRGGLPDPAADARGAGVPGIDSGYGEAVPRRPARGAGRARRCRPRSPTSSSPTRCSWSAASRSTTRRSSTCGSARACAGAASSSRSRPRGPSALDPNAGWSCATPPGGEAAFLAALDGALAGGERGRSGCERRLAELLRDGGEDIVIIWGERCLGAAALRALLASPSGSAWPIARGAGLLEIPAGANGRGLREAGVVPGAGPGLLRDYRRGCRAAARARSRGGRRRRHHRAVPVPDRPGARPARPRAVGAGAPPRRAGRGARVGPDRGPGRARQRGVPGRVPRREGGDGRASRRPPAAPAHRDRPSGLGPRGLVGDRRASPSAPASNRRADLADGVHAAGRRRSRSTAGSRSRRSAGRGVRWPEREAASASAAAERGGVRSLARAHGPGPRRPARGDGAGSANGALRLGRYRSIWAVARGRDLPGAPVHRGPPAGRARTRGRPAARDRQRRDGRGVAERDAPAGTAHVRTGVPAGTAFLADGIAARLGQRVDRTGDRGAASHDHVSPTSTTSSPGGSRSSSRW